MSTPRADLGGANLTEKWFGLFRRIEIASGIHLHCRSRPASRITFAEVANDSLKSSKHKTRRHGDEAEVQRVCVIATG